MEVLAQLVGVRKESKTLFFNCLGALAYAAGDGKRGRNRARGTQSRVDRMRDKTCSNALAALRADSFGKLPSPSRLISDLEKTSPKSLWQKNFVFFSWEEHCGTLGIQRGGNEVSTSRRDSAIARERQKRCQKSRNSRRVVTC